MADTRDDPELDFRKLVEKYATEGQVKAAGKYILQVKQQELGLTQERSDEIIDEVLAHSCKRLENIELYKKALREEVEQNYPLNEGQKNILQELQNILRLKDSDIAKDQQQILAEKEAERQYQIEIQRQEQEEYKIKLQQYKQEFVQAVEQEYPLSDSARNKINNLQQSLKISAEDIKRIEQPILTQRKTRYQEKLKESDELIDQMLASDSKLKQQKAEQQKRKIQQQETDYQQRLQQYEQKVSYYIRQGISPLHFRRELQQLQKTLRLTDFDVSSIESKFVSPQNRLVSQRSTETEVEDRAKKVLIASAFLLLFLVFALFSL